MSSIFIYGASTVTTACYNFDKETVELIELNMKLQDELELYFQCFTPVEPVKIYIQDSGINITSPPSSSIPKTLFIYNIHSSRTRQEIQQKFNSELPFPVSSSQLPTTPSLSHSSSSNSTSPTSSSTESFKRKCSCFSLSKFFQKIKSRVQTKSKPPPSPFPITSTFDYTSQFNNVGHVEEWDVQVPVFLDMLASFFQNERFLKQKGIFRLSSNVGKLDDFINEFRSADEKMIQEVKINQDIVSQFHLEPCDAIKRWLRELPGKVFYEKMNKNLEYIAKMGITEGSIEILRALVFQLDITRQNILKYILQVSHQVLKYTDSNCMDGQCLARTIGPNLFFLEASSIHSFNWSMDIFKLLLSKDVDYWFTLPTTE